MLGLERLRRARRPDGRGLVADPIPIALGGTAIGIGMGVAHGCAIMDDHSLRCWGRNATGAVGTGSTSASVGSPTAVAVVSNVVEVEGGFQHTCARRMDDTIRCWGNARGQCGANPLDNPRLIAANPGISGARDLALGHAHTCVSHAGRVSCFRAQQRSRAGQRGARPAPQLRRGGGAPDGALQSRRRRPRHAHRVGDDRLPASPSTERARPTAGATTRSASSAAAAPRRTRSCRSRWGRSPR
ncbi:MAG: hypothetical protein M5U28_19935 [Sandaracinaceae bacterium]|nr:hypothetical protein [Sandaracinaceae bacterium]